MNKKILLVIAVLAGAALTARANLVVNGGFETGGLSPWTISGDTSFTGVGSGFQHSGNYEFYSGPTSSDGFLDQTIPTVSGQAYIVDFWLTNGDVTGNNRFGASFGGITLVPEGAQPGFGYTEFTFTVTPGANADLHFIFYNPPGFFYLDDVSVNAVPEPGTLGLIALGTLGLVGAVRKRHLV